MVRHFIHLPEHRESVLLLYRHILRNAKQCCHSQHLIYRIKKITKRIIVKHRHNKSSWTVYFYLEKLHQLNGLLTERDTKAIWKLLTDISKQKSKSKKSSKQTSKILKSLEEIYQLKQRRSVQDPRIVREKLILNEYIRKGQALGQLPWFIPEEYKIELLLPLALHEKSMIRLNKIRDELSTTPKVFLTHTAPAGHKIWFIRSALNKKKRQSKALGSIIRKEKFEGLKRSFYLRQCKTNAYWALQEANWELLMNNKHILQFDLSKYLHSATLADKQKVERTPQLMDWLEPITYSIQSLIQANAEKATYFKNYKNKILFNGKIQYFKNKSLSMHRKREERFKQMIQNDLPYVVPFFPNRDLPSTLSKYRF